MRGGTFADIYCNTVSITGRDVLVSSNFARYLLDGPRERKRGKVQRNQGDRDI